MSVDFYANEFDVIDWDDIKKIIPDEAADFERQLQTAGMDLDTFCRAMEDDDWDIGDCTQDSIDSITDAWDKLDEAFRKTTTVKRAGLSLNPKYRTPSFDNRDGVAFFAVDGVHQLTPAGAKYKGEIYRRQFMGVG